MNDWAAGYRAALADVEQIARARNHNVTWLSSLLEELKQDALVIDHEQTNRLQKRKMAAAREALPLFGDVRRTHSTDLVQGAADKAVEERARLYRRYRAARKAHRDAIYNQHPLGSELQAFAGQLSRYTISDGAAMLTYVREMARSWLTVAPPEIRAEALSIVNEHIIAIRIRAGLVPIDDPLPGEEADVFQLCKAELAP